jgi:hypothetical protein
MLGLFFKPEDEATCSSEKTVYFQQTTRRYMQVNMHFYVLVN